MANTYTIKLPNEFPFDPNTLQLNTTLWHLHRSHITPMKIRAIQVNNNRIFYKLASISHENEPVYYLDNVSLSDLNHTFFLSETQAIQALQAQ